MGTVTLPITSRTSADDNDFNDCFVNDAALRDQINGNLDADNLANGAVTDAKLASPNNGVYKTLVTANAYMSAQIVAVYYVSITGKRWASGYPVSDTQEVQPHVLYFDDADYAVASKTQKLRVRMQVAVGSTSPSTTVLTGGLYPISVSGGNWTLGSVVSGTTAASTGLATNTLSSFASSDATIPSDGAYCLGVAVTSATVPSGIAVSLQLQTRNV